MGHFCVIGFVVFALCLFSCGPASAVDGVSKTEPPAVTKENAEQAVSDAKNSITAVSSKAESEVARINAVLKRVEAFKTTVKEAESQAEQALSQGEKAAQDNEEAKSLVANIKSISNTVSTSYQSVNDNVENANKSLREVLKKAATLKTKWDKEDVAVKQSAAIYKDIRTQALEIKNEAVKLENNITDASTIISGIESTAQQMEESAKDVQLKKIQVCCIVSVAKIEAKGEEANGIITNMQTQKRDVNAIVEEMQKHCTPATTESNKSIKALCESVNNALTKVTDAVDKAKEAEKEMVKEKRLGDAALKIVQAATVVANAQQELNKAETCVTTVEKNIVPKLKSAIKTAESSLTSATTSKDKLVTALSKTNNQPSTEQTTETQKFHSPVGQGTEPTQKNTTTQTTITDTEQPTSKDSPDQGNKSANKLKDALSTGAQNVSTTALTGKKAPAPGANNDSAMTVSVPLLVALIASALLQ